MILDRLRVLPQYLLPQHLASVWMHRFMQVRRGWVKRLQIEVVRRLYDVRLEEALEPDPGAYPTFNAFFTRALQPAARPIAPAPAVAAPADGTVSAAGHVAHGELIQAKGRTYRLDELVVEPALAEAFADAAYATVYLSPRDYHRVHVPTDATLRETLYVPGRLFSVNSTTTRTVPRLFARNERLICVLDTALGPMAVILVGAIFVGSMETVWGGQVTPPYGHEIVRQRYAPGTVRLARGAELGRFNMGSTVVLLCAGGAVRWREDLVFGRRVRMGEELGTWRADPGRDGG